MLLGLALADDLMRRRMIQIDSVRFLAGKVFRVLGFAILYRLNYISYGAIGTNLSGVVPLFILSGNKQRYTGATWPSTGRRIDAAARKANPSD